MAKAKAESKTKPSSGATSKGSRSSKSSTQNAVRRSAITAEKFVAAVRASAADRTHPLPPSPWIALAGDSYRVRQLVQWMAEQLLPTEQSRGSHTGHGRRRGLSIYFGGDLSASDTNRSVIETFSMPSLFEPYQLIVCYSAELAKEAHIAPIVDAARNARHASLLLHYPEEKKIHKIEGTVIRFEDLKGVALQRWIDREMKKRTGRACLAPGAIEALAARYEGSLNHLSQELDKIALALQPSEVCTLERLQTLTALELDTESFALMHELARKDVIQATTLARKLLDQGLHPLQIVSFLSRCYRTLLARPARNPYAKHASDPESRSELHSELSNYYFRKNVDGIASLLSPRDLVRSIRYLSILDHRLKMSGLDPETLIEIAATKLATRRFDLSSES